MKRRIYTYPGPIPKIGLVARIPPAIRSLRGRLSNNVSSNVELRLVNRPFKGLVPGDIPLIVLSHNEARFIPAFLKHYRHLGVTRFLWVDDLSTDGSREQLTAHPDVDLYTSNVRYKDAKRGRIWREMLVESYGRNRWYVSVDIDEFLVYRGCQTVPISGLANALQKRGILHMHAPMIDLYPPGKVVAAHYSGTENEMPWDIASHFDRNGYSAVFSSHGLRISGGVRKRAFGYNPLLTKFPLVYWQERTRLSKTVHEPSPFLHNFEYPLGTLLHFKFFSDYAQRFGDNVTSGQHFAQAQAYKDILDTLHDTEALILENEMSVAYRDAEDLYRLGFFADWRNGRAAYPLAR